MLDEKKIKELAKICYNNNIFPIFLPMYLHSRSDKNHPIAGVLNKLVNECMEYLTSMDSKELQGFIKKIPAGLQTYIDHEEKTGRLNLSRISVYYIIGLLHQYKIKIKDIINSSDEGNVIKFYPKLKEKLDKDGLLTLDKDFIIHDGGLEYKEHMLQYHQFLRRGFSSNPNFTFFDKFIELYHKTNNQNIFRIAIDRNRLMLKKHYQQISEFDTWYGPKFDSNRIDDPNYLGLTIVKRNKKSLMELENKMDRTEFYWSYKDGIKTLEIEEICELDYKYDSYNINKYAHLERNVENKCTQHLDGAVKIYLGDKYGQRFETNIPKEPRSFRKIKLFRIDGEIDMESCIELVSYFFKSNEMIIEYFNPEQYNELFGHLIRQ